ncbi:MAG: YkgJ family cysteine cluster protein [Candidatus Lokiarchaeota archaeon]|nr:YkgJ family cysteine cluster protein [Candidatus Lokiarchaeota archaeon]
MDCKRCGKCCVDVPMTPQEYRELATRFPAIAAAAVDYGFAVEIRGPCPLLAADHSCTAYEYRARVCRMFPVAVTGHDGASFTLAPSASCPSAGTVTQGEIDQAKALHKEYNAEMACNWKEYQATHPGARQAAVDFLASRLPARTDAGGGCAGDALASVVERYGASLTRRRVVPSTK